MIKTILFFLSLSSHFYALSIQDIVTMQKKLNQPQTWFLFKKHYHPPRFVIPNIIDIENPIYPELQVEIFETTDDAKERCIISYASYNLNYPGSLKVISNCLKKTGFRGHFLYRLGGWPNMEQDGFDLIDVPYAFKIKAFQEARQLGYKNILWIDSSMRPTQNLDFIFEYLENHGLFFNLNSYFSQRLDSIPRTALLSLNLTQQDLIKIRYVNTGVIGFNFEKPKALQFFDQFYFLAQKKISFYNGFFEELPFSVLIKRLNMENLEYKDTFPLFQYIELSDQFHLDRISDYKATFAIDYTYSKKWHPLSSER